MKAIVIMAITVICIAVAQILTTYIQIKVWRRLLRLQQLQFDGKQVADALKTTGIGLTDRQVKKMSIEKDIRFIAESIEWQNKFLADIFSNKDSDSCSNERNSKEIADLPTKMLKGQPELTIDSKAVAKAAQKAIHGTAAKDR